MAERKSPLRKWSADYYMKAIPRMDDAVLIEGLPGIGNVGKVAVDFMIDELKASKVLDLFSYSLPHSVFINEKNLVDLPAISIYHVRLRGSRKNIIFISGDIQPINEEACYEFCDEVLQLVKGFGAKEVVTLGGIGLSEIPKSPRVYITGTAPAIVRKYAKDTKAITRLYGVVGPIVGVSGVMLGMAKRNRMKGVSLLAETYGHPMYLGMKGAREILKILVKRLSIRISMKELNREIEKIEKDIVSRADELASARQTRAVPGRAMVEENSYIG